MPKVTPGITIRRQLSRLMLENGVVYFLALATIDAFTLSALNRYINSTTTNFYFLTYFIDTVSAILICRFILSLRSVDLPRSNVPGEQSVSGSGHSVWSSTLRFADQIRSFDVVANIGAPLDHGEEVEREHSSDVGIGEFHGDSILEYPVAIETTQDA
ncbi:hypothetical protein NLI96_g10522 [Meripilus lineatus]|uniref:Uncharacterized protein n=1 Tax=Meripilus lineatus TaxID=2056292 RepID=A0AAD5UV38_9APHY|nr:hypothetical protein NLI96_g10522 [Physisporinus lineatus]